MIILRGSILVPLAGFALIVLPIAYGARQLHLAHDQREAAVSAFEATRAHAQEVVELRSMVQRINDRQRPEQDMIARVHAAMQQAGIAVPAHFQSLRPESDVELAGRAGLRFQSVAVSLAGLSVPQLGSLLLQWERQQPLWALSRIAMTHVRSASQPQDFERFDVVLTFGAVYAAEETGS